MSGEKKETAKSKTEANRRPNVIEPDSSYNTPITDKGLSASGVGIIDQ